jgi:hypothetical protein
MTSGGTSAQPNTDNLQNDLYGAGAIGGYDDFERVLQLSRNEAEQNERLKRQEEEELDRILQLSLLDK